MSAPAFVYVVPARFEDILKIGFSRDPCHRVRSFHARYFEYFDLDRGFLIAAMDDKDARRIERLLALRFADHRTHAPLVVDRSPGGSTEWYRGAYPLVLQVSTQVVADGGYPPLCSLSSRIREELLREREHLFEHAIAVLDTVEALGREDPRAVAIAAAFRNLLDAFHAFDITVEEYLPDDIASRLTLASPT